MDETIATTETPVEDIPVEEVVTPEEEVVVADNTIEYVPANQVSQLPFSAGDFILTHRNDWVANLIKRAQSHRFKGADSIFARFSHCAMIVSDDGEIVEALTKTGVTRGHISKYQASEYVVVRTLQTREDRQQITDFAVFTVGRKYGWITCISLYLSLLTGLKFNFGVDGQLICSGLVAEALERGTDKFERDSTHMLPADLAAHYNVRF